jgi:putative Holliday junction resolvase
MSELKLRRRIVGIDLGAARIGVAASDELGLLAHPVETVPAGSGAVKRIAEIVQEKNADRVIVGLPRHMNGATGTGAVDALAFAKKLETILSCPVLTWDERLSTTAANRALRDSGRKSRNSRQIVDQVAAQMILQGYLDSLQADEIFQAS